MLTRLIFSFVMIAFPCFIQATLYVGAAKTDITPPNGTPSAGYAARKNQGMTGVHDPLLATALFINNEKKAVVFCSVDNLGFTQEITQAIIAKVHALKELEDVDIFIASSHTHSGGGSHINIPLIGDFLAGPYDEQITTYYIDQTAKAIVQAYINRIPAKAGIGYGKANRLSQFKSKWPDEAQPLEDIMVIKFTTLDNLPLALVFNYALHPTVLKATNLLFSADFIGYTRDHLLTLLGNGIHTLFINGAQAEIQPIEFAEQNPYDTCEYIGVSLADSVKQIWDQTATSSCLTIHTHKDSYVLKPEATTAGLKLPLQSYLTEMNILVLNKNHAFLTIPGELSTVYADRVNSYAQSLGYMHATILGLTNDSHGYIITPEAWRHKTSESGLSFGGENYGEFINTKAENLLQQFAPS